MQTHARKLSNVLKPIFAATILILAVMACREAASAKTTAAGEKQKIESLITMIGGLKDAKFVRNGSTYSAATAATFLRRKWQANEAKVKTARDFIDNVASFSGTSGKPYLIRFDNGQEVKSYDFLTDELKKLEAARPATGG